MLRYANRIQSLSYFTNYMNVRFKSDRRVLVPDYSLRTKPGKTISIEVAEYSDLGLIESYCKEHFVTNEPLSVFHEVDPMRFFTHCLTSVVESCVRFPYTTLAFDSGKMIGYNFVWLEVWDKNTEVFPIGGLNDLERLRQKYTKLLKLNNDDPESYLLTTVNHAAYITPNFLPEGDKHIIAHGEMGSVNREYRHNGVLLAMIIEGAKQLAQDKIADYYYATATAAATVHLNPTYGLKEVWSMKYKDIKYDGKNIYGDGVLHDGNDKITINLGKVKEMANYDYVNVKRK
ncbi:unnamed protein product [Bursaphelenchus okinawaensis]|uniref:N-acetyltransferase domain-containing protein n=1 Tax=Bursaphelenchus okinawaensis TaxID=465554 RepID=A0A811KGA5_9BILA|nr:unnamed protein product [Bursaphelenchus okinawaensis]CAG9102642.1 unnamed protein product [Bursaphelenchus okinawaensis]